MNKTYTGSCHCGAVRFEADIDLSAGTGKCNCSICSKGRNWSASIKPDAFRLLAGADALSDYQFGTHSIHHPFCRTCGLHVFSHGHIEETGGDFVAVQVAALDNLEAQQLLEAPVKYSDGLHNNWWNAPAETRHL